MNQRVSYGITRKVSKVCIVLFASLMMSAVAVSQEKNPLTVTLSHGIVTQDAPIPAIPDDQSQQCPPFSTIQGHQPDGKYLPCPVVAEAGVPFNGWIVTQNACGGDNIRGIVAQSQFTTVGPLNDPGYPDSKTENFDIYYSGPQGSWPDREHLGGSHVWQDPGQWSIGGQARVDCDRKGTQHWWLTPMIGAQATVFEPTAPQSITALGNGASPGKTYHQFGRVTLFSSAPASGSLVMLTTEKPNVIDVQTKFATTGLQGAGSGLVYSSTYLYVPPGQQSADFDVLVASSATPGDVVKIFAKCVGIPGNWKITNECDEVNKHPQVLRVTITP